jgi:hypothetical protein
MWRRWPGKTRGAIGFALNFFVSFFFQEKKERQELAVSKYIHNTLEVYSTSNSLH